MNYYTGTCRGGSCQPDACGTYVTIQGPAGPTGPEGPRAVSYTHLTLPTIA